MADRTGQHLGHYRLVRLLGQGGFAEVYLGEHIHLGTEAAIKLLHTQLAGEDTDAFRTEARTIARLMHPHIVRVFDFGIEGETPYLVMDYAPGGTVRKRHPKGVALPLPTILGYVKQVADALQYAHDEHFIHRDVKPENLLVGRRQEILLSDFGIALLAQTSRSQSMQDVTGTASYMAPEQLQGKPRQASDQYSLAVMVYEWLTGTCPFHGSFTEIYSQHLFVPPPPLREQVPDLSPAVEQVVLTALAKDPHQRFGSVHAFATAFEQASQVEARAGGPFPFSLDAVTDVSESQQPTQLATALSQSSIPTELATSASHALPTGRVMPSPQPLPVPPEPLHVSPSPGTVLCTYRGHSDGILGLAWSPDGRRIASASHDRVVVWNAATGREVFTCSQPSGAAIEGEFLAWSPDGTRIASSRMSVYIIDATTGRELFHYVISDSGACVAWSPDSTRIASSGRGSVIHVWDAQTGSDIFAYKGHENKLTPGSVTSIAWAPDGKRIVSSAIFVVYSSANRSEWKGEMQVWDAITGRKLFTYQGHSDATDGAVAWSPDGTRIASASSGDSALQVWDATTGQTLYTYRGHAKASVITLAWSPDGKYIASGSTGEKTVQIWEATTGKPFFTYSGHADPVWTLAWSPDGSRIASGSNDKTVQVWQAP